MKTICLYNHKGGVGKTTMCAAIDIALETGRVTNLVYGQALKTSGDAIFPTIIGAIFMYLCMVGGTYFFGIHLGLLVADCCRGLIRNLGLIQSDEKNPSDCATEPHNITHICDALRYFCATRTLAAQVAAPVLERDAYETETDYDEEMTGGEMTGSYLTYGGG